jgi:hypothetical protein
MLRWEIFSSLGLCRVVEQVFQFAAVPIASHNGPRRSEWSRVVRGFIIICVFFRYCAKDDDVPWPHVFSGAKDIVYSIRSDGDTTRLWRCWETMADQCSCFTAFPDASRPRHRRRNSMFCAHRFNTALSVKSEQVSKSNWVVVREQVELLFMCFCCLDRGGAESMLRELEITETEDGGGCLAGRGGGD